MKSAVVLSEDDIEFVRQLAVKAGQKAIEMRDQVEVKQKSGPDDPVTSADVALSKLIVEQLSQRFAQDLIISEEDRSHPDHIGSKRIWLIDPIDGTKNYISGNGQYSVMIGLLEDLKPVFGFVYEAEAHRCYFGGPEYGAFLSVNSERATKISGARKLDNQSNQRIIMGSRDRRRNPWIADIDGVEIVKTGSIGLKVARILEEKADILVHLSGRLKTWDTAAPAAIALGGNLEIGSFRGPQLDFPLPNLIHKDEVIMGRIGCLSWCKTKLTAPE